MLPFTPIPVMTREEYYIEPGPQPEKYELPTIHPHECDHDGVDDVDLNTESLCGQCCPCDMCGEDRWETVQQVLGPQNPPPSGWRRFTINKSTGEMTYVEEGA